MIIAIYLFNPSDLPRLIHHEVSVAFFISVPHPIFNILQQVITAASKQKGSFHSETLTLAFIYISRIIRSLDIINYGKNRAEMVNIEKEILELYPDYIWASKLVTGGFKDALHPKQEPPRIKTAKTQINRSKLFQSDICFC